MSEQASIATLVAELSQHHSEILAGLVALPVGGYLLGSLLLKVQERVAAWFLSIVVHAAVFLVIPSAIVLAYLGLGSGVNLYSDVDALITFGPVLSGVLTLILVPQLMDLDDIPGFDRIRGLAGMVALCFGVVFFLSRTRIMLWFFVRPTMSQIFLLAVGLYLAFRTFFGMMTRRASRPGMN